MIVLKKIPVPPWEIDSRIKGPSGGEGIRILKDRRVPGGGWHHVIRDGKPIVTIYCPACGFEGDLDHEISAQGHVMPSVVCPRDGCEFHNVIRLDNYEA